MPIDPEISEEECQRLREALATRAEHYTTQTSSLIRSIGETSGQHPQVLRSSQLIETFDTIAGMLSASSHRKQERTLRHFAGTLFMEERNLQRHETEKEIELTETYNRELRNILTPILGDERTRMLLNEKDAMHRAYEDDPGPRRGMEHFLHDVASTRRGESGLRIVRGDIADAPPPSLIARIRGFFPSLLSAIRQIFPSCRDEKLIIDYLNTQVPHMRVARTDSDWGIVTRSFPVENDVQRKTLKTIIDAINETITPGSTEKPDFEQPVNVLPDTTPKDNRYFLAIRPYAYPALAAFIKQGKNPLQALENPLPKTSTLPSDALDTPGKLHVESIEKPPKNSDKEPPQR